MSKIAFADIDTQVDFIEPNGRLYAQGAEAIKPRLAQLVQAARAQNIPLVSSVDAHNEHDAEFEQFPPHCLKNTEGQMKLAETTTGVEVFLEQGAVDFPDPTSHHLVVEKQQFPIFTNPVAEKVFAAIGADTIYVFGVVTEVCVYEAVMGLRQRGYQVKLVTDAVWPISQEGGEKALAEMKEAGVDFVTTEETLAAVAA